MVYKITAKELTKIINEETNRAILENKQDEKFLGIDFGVQTRKENRLNTFKYARLFGNLVNQVQSISDQLSQRLEILQSVAQTETQQTQYQQPQGQVAEGFLGKATAGTVKLIGRNGLKAGLRASKKLYGKKAIKYLMVGGLSAMVLSFLKVPQTIGQWIEKFKNPGQTTPQDVISAYGEVADWMQGICQVTQENPELLGAAALQDSTLGGPEEVKNKFKVSDGIALAASFGTMALGPIGWAYDALDIAGSLVSAKANSEQEGLQVVEKQYQYITNAIADMNQALQQSTTPQAAPVASQQQQVQQYQQPQQQTQMAQNQQVPPQMKQKYPWLGA